MSGSSGTSAKPGSLGVDRPRGTLGDQIAELLNSIKHLKRSNKYMITCDEYKTDRDLQDAVLENELVIAKQYAKIEELKKHRAAVAPHYGRDAGEDAGSAGDSKEPPASSSAMGTGTGSSEQRAGSGGGDAKAPAQAKEVSSQDEGFLL